MADYKEMYLSIFTDVSKAIEILRRAQQKTEEIFMSSDDPVIHLTLPDGDGHNKD